MEILETWRVACFADSLVSIWWALDSPLAGFIVLGVSLIGRMQKIGALATPLKLVQARNSTRGGDPSSPLID